MIANPTHDEQALSGFTVVVSASELMANGLHYMPPKNVDRGPLCLRGFVGAVGALLALSINLFIVACHTGPVVCYLMVRVGVRAARMLFVCCM